jgi:hypothetical protein
MLSATRFELKKARGYSLVIVPGAPPPPLILGSLARNARNARNTPSMYFVLHTEYVQYLCVRVRWVGTAGHVYTVQMVYGVLRTQYSVHNYITYFVQPMDDSNVTLYYPTGTASTSKESVHQTGVTLTQPPTRHITLSPATLTANMAPLSALLRRNLRVYQIYGANTDVGKTIFATLLSRTAAKIYRPEYTSFLKPVSTGPLDEADSQCKPPLLSRLACKANLTPLDVPGPM